MNIIVKSILVVIISVFLINIQVWIVRTIFPQAQQRKKILLSTLLMGSLVASALLIFTYIIQPQLPQYSIRYSIYIGIIWGLLSIVFAYKKKWWLLFFVSTTTVIAIITGIAEIVIASTSIALLLLKASGEEILKTSTAQSLSSHETLYSSDVIIYSILAGLGFALFENIVYFITQESIGQFIWRSITLSLLHGIFTWVIWFTLWKQWKATFVSYIIAYCIGISFHAAYNMWIMYNPLVTGIISTLWWYFLLSYLLYKSDRLYNNS